MKKVHTKRKAGVVRLNLVNYSPMMILIHSSKLESKFLLPPHSQVCAIKISGHWDSQVCAITSCSFPARMFDSMCCRNTPITYDDCLASQIYSRFIRDAKTISSRGVESNPAPVSPYTLSEHLILLCAVLLCLQQPNTGWKYLEGIRILGCSLSSEFYMSTFPPNTSKAKNGCQQVYRILEFKGP